MVIKLNTTNGLAGDTVEKKKETTAPPVEEIRISVQLQPNQRDGFERVFNRFYKETGIKVESIVATDLEYKMHMSDWLLEGKNTPDVMYWCSSQRLYFYAEKGAIQPITKLWNDNNLDQVLSHVKPGVTYNGEVYAIPFAYYHWGIFYKKSLVEKFGGIPGNWEEFLAICERMKKAGITPIGIGTKEHWPAAAWFDYINLRINGLPFHLKLLGGKVSFYDQRVQKVLLEWKKLIDRNFYNKDNRLYTWEGVLPLFYRNRIGFLLLGNFVASKWPKNEEITEDIGFMPFPKIADIPYYEDAPTDVFFIPANTKKIKEAQKFISFISRADVQSNLNKDLGYVPPNKKAIIGQDRFIQAGNKMLKQAAGLAQFFDRDTTPEFDKIATPLLSEFLNTGNIEDVTKKLENARRQVFGPIAESEPKTDVEK